MHKSFLRSEPCISADDDAVGAWARLLAHASELEVARGEPPLGELLITDCKHWGDRQWLAATGTDTTGVGRAAAARLVYWEDTTLVVTGGDLEGLERVLKLRANGRLGGRKPKPPTPEPEQNQSPTNGKPELSQGRTGAEPLSSPLPSPPFPTSPSPASPEDRPPAAPAGPCYSAEFLKFWEAYPKKVKKLKAAKIWAGKKPPLDRVLAALRWQIKSHDWMMGFIPHPSTYLNDGRWDDDEASASLARGGRDVKRGHFRPTASNGDAPDAAREVKF